MIRATRKRLFVPIYPFIIGGRPSERGMLYRQSAQNQFARLNQINYMQRTSWENFKVMMAQHPDIELWRFLLLCTVVWALVFYREAHPITSNFRNNQRHHGYNLNPNDLAVRNSTMREVFDNNEQLIAELRAGNPKPEILQAPTHLK